MVNQFDIWQQNRGRTTSVAKEKTKKKTVNSALAKYIPALSRGAAVGPDGLATQRDAWGNAMQQMRGVNATTPLVAGAQALGMGMAGYGMKKAQDASDAGTADYRKRLSDALSGKADNATLMGLAFDPWADAAGSEAALKMWERNNPTEDQLLQRRAAQQQLKAGDQQFETSQFNLDQAREKADREEQIRLGHQSAVDKYMNDPAYKAQGGDLFSPDMQMMLRQNGIEGVSPEDAQMHQDLQPFVNARDYDKAFETLTQPEDKSDYITVDGALYNRRTGQWVQNPNGGLQTDDIKEWQRNNQDRATRGEPPLSMQDYMIQMKKAGASSMNLDMSGGTDKQVFEVMNDRFKDVRSAERGILALREAKRAILSGAITGPWADERLFLSKLGAAVGLNVAPEKIANTEVFRSSMAQQVAAMVRATVGSTQISNTDREFAEAAAGGKITLDENTILRLIDLGERANMQAIDDYQGRLDKVYDPTSQDPGVIRSRALYEVNDPAPMPGDITRLPGGEAEADAAYEALEPGTWFQAPDGTIRQKPSVQ